MPGNDLSATRAKIPTSGVTATATAQANVSQVLTDIIDDLEPNITPSQMDMDSNLSFLYDGSYYATTNLGYANFQNRSDGPGVDESLYVKNDELYFRDGAGNDFAMTSGGGLSGVGLGGITGGGYGAPIELNWNGTQYRFKDGSGPNDFAPVVMSHMHLRDGSGNDLTQTVPTLAAGYTLTWPSAVSGGASRALQSDASGGLSWSNSFSEDITLTSSAVYKFNANRVTLVPPSSCVSDATNDGAMTSDGASYNVLTAGIIFVPIRIPSGHTINQISCFVKQGSAGTVTVELFYTDSGTATTTGSSNTTTSTGSFTEVILSSIAETTTGNRSYYLKVSATSSGTLDVGTTKVLHNYT